MSNTLVNEAIAGISQNHWGFRVGTGSLNFPDYTDFYRSSVGLDDDARSRLIVGGWSAMVEDMVLRWLDGPDGMSRAQLLRVLTEALPALARAGID